MSNTTYAEKLQHPNWQKKRLEILQRDNFKCQYCDNTQKQLQVHHLKYKSFNDPADTPDEFLITCCCDCHSIIESFKKDNYPVVKIQRNGVNNYRVYSIVNDKKTIFFFKIIPGGLECLWVLNEEKAIEIMNCFNTFYNNVEQHDGL